MKLYTVLTIGKSIAIKREKGDDDNEQTFAHLKFTGMVAKREEVNDIAGQRPGWCETSFFDEMGAPLDHWTLALRKREFVVTGHIRGHGDGNSLKLAKATLSGIELEFVENAAMVSGQLVWPIAGDEAGDAEPLLGRECIAAWVLEDGGQQDMLRDRAA